VTMSLSSPELVDLRVQAAARPHNA
jgi:hypothetical protein